MPSTTDTLIWLTVSLVLPNHKQLIQVNCMSYICNAPDLMRQVSVSYSSSLPCHLLACCTLPCHHLHFISCHHVHRICICVRLMHPSIFPVVPFAIRRSYVPRCPLLPFSVSVY